jgi:hypothetical protein
MLKFLDKKTKANLAALISKLSKEVDTETSYRLAAEFGL